MIKSMTGFGKATGSYNDRQLTVEIKSVNSKGLDLNLRIPNRFREKEQELKTELSRHVERGKVDLSLHFESTDAPKAVMINKELAKAYFEDLKEISDQLNLSGSDYLSLLLRMPEVMTSETPSAMDEKEWNELLSICRKAVDNFNSFRAAEGKTLEKDLTVRIKLIETYLREIEKIEPKRIESIRERLSRNMNEFLPSLEVDRNRLEQELIYYLEKLDITEEKVRLRSHCEYFLGTMNEETSNGRKLGFISQEIGREINTIGSKANDAAIQKFVVQMKDELEKIKEQVLNVL